MIIIHGAFSRTVDNERQVSFVVPVAGSDVRFAVGLGHSLVTVSWDTTSNQTKNGPVRVESEIPFGVDYPGVLIVAKTDGHGRMFIGKRNSFRVRRLFVKLCRLTNQYVRTRTGRIAVLFRSRKL